MEKFYGASAWLVYLIEHFLKPHASASTSGLDYFGDFDFDHVLNGIVAACRRDTRQLYLIHVEDNAVFEEPIIGSDLRRIGLGPLPYENERDRWAASRRPKRGANR